MEPTVDKQRLTQTYRELQTMEVRLDTDPIRYGPKRFNNQIARVRSMLSRLEQIFLQVSEDLHFFKRQLRNKKMLYELERRDLMVNDARCKVGRSQGEREALADVQLRGDIEEIQRLSGNAEDLEILMTAIKTKRSDLKDTQGRMRDQMKMIDQDLSMGARWGKEAAPKTPDGPISFNPQEEEDDSMESLMRDLGMDDGETPSDGPVDTESSSSNEAVSSFLDSLDEVASEDTPKVSITSISSDDLLSDLLS